MKSAGKKMLVAASPNVLLCFKQTAQRGEPEGNLTTGAFLPGARPGELVLTSVCFEKGKVRIQHSFPSQVPWISEVSVFTLMV